MTVTPTQHSAPGGGGAAFDISRRGYDRDQVDAQLGELRHRLSTAENARRAAEQHALATEDELRTARSSVSEPAMSQESFGFRAEKILRLAEHEAADVRGRAANEATALVEQARAEAERHRHDVEQKLIARAAELDQEAAQRDVAIREREQQSTATLAGAREEATRITEDAQRAADALVTEAQNRAEEIRHRSEQDARRRREAAEQELKRIGGIHDGVRAEMARLHKTLAGELGKPSPSDRVIPPNTGTSSLPGWVRGFTGLYPRRLVPRTDLLLADPRLVAVAERISRSRVKAAVVEAQGRARRGELPADVEAVVRAALAALPATAAAVQPVLNATGVLLHTNLGRAPLSAAAVEALALAAGTCDVELDLTTGGRGRRGATTIDALLEAVPAAGAAHLVNNGAAALALVAMTLAQGREVVVSRGELVEIGDGFRLPDLVASTGARLREVGTTNRTSRADYAAAIGPDTAFVLKVHPSNFVMRGFTHSCDVAELADLGVPLVVDIGSGLLAPHPLLPDEPDATSTLAAGATLVTGSGDKLLGGPQAGLLLGAPGTGAELVARIRRHPMARAMRVDKLTLAAMEATLRGPLPPTRIALETSAAALLARAELIVERLARAGVVAEAVGSESTVGGGGAPDVVLASAAVALPERYAAALRAGRPAVLGHVEHGRCLLDLRALPPTADEQLAVAVLACAGDPPGGEGSPPHLP